MFATLFAVRTAWVAILVILVCLGLIWFAFRVVVDFVTWFKEEIIDDIRDNRRKAKEKRKAKREPEEDA